MGRAEKPGTEAKLNAIMVLLALWMGAWGISVWAILLRRSGEIGLSNLQLALGWQAVAGLLAFAIWGIGLGLRRGHGVRRLSLAPLAIALVVGALVAIVWGQGA